MYKRFSMNDLPPSLKKRDTFDYKECNNWIRLAFSKTDLIEDFKSTSVQRIYLPTTKINNVKTVQIINRIGAELKYSVYNNTGSYANYVDIDRKLVDGEQCRVIYSIDPIATELLNSPVDTVYLKDNIYKTLIELLYNYAKSDIIIK